MAALTLAEIAIKAEQLYTQYPDAAADYRRAKQGCAIPLPPHLPRHLINDSRRDFQVQNEHCRQYWMDLRIVRVAAAGMFPDLHLRIVPLAGKPWHDQDDFDWPAACTELQRVVDAAISEMNKPAPPKSPDRRDEWIYREVMKGTKYSSVIRALREKPKTWDRIDTVNGIKDVAKRYAKNNTLPQPPTRQPGRKQKAK